MTQPMFEGMDPAEKRLEVARCALRDAKIPLTAAAWEESTLVYAANPFRNRRQQTPDERVTWQQAVDEWKAERAQARGHR